MQTSVVRASSVALLLTGIGAVSKAAPSLHTALAKAKKCVQSEALKADAEEANVPYQWALPSFIQAGLVQKEASLFFGGSYASYKGRSFTMAQGQVAVGVTDSVQLLFGEQSVLAKGRASTSRFTVRDDYYGFRAVVKRPTQTDPTALSIQYETIQPGTADVNIANASETYAGTSSNVFSLNYLDRKEDQLQIQYTNIAAGPGLYAHVYSAGFGHDYQLSEFVRARLQANLVAESFQAVAETSNFELRPILTGALALTPTPWLSVEGDLTALPAGLPLAGSEFTGLSSFDLYSPGGIVNSLRSDFVGFASLRVLFHGKF